MNCNASGLSFPMPVGQHFSGHSGAQSISQILGQPKGLLQHLVGQ